MRFVIAGLMALFMLMGGLSAQETHPTPRSFQDRRYALSLTVPAGWTLTTRDREVSTFHLDARSAPGTARLRAVINIDDNPLPHSNFAGAFLYFSVTPGATDASCSRQATHPDGTREIAGLTFAHGHDEQASHICTESRDEIYTAYRKHACYRFDLVINTFCAEVSGAEEMTPEELENIRKRMESILDSVRF